MKVYRPSRTAEHTALFRAMETVRTPDRIVEDPMACQFLSFGFRLIARVSRNPSCAALLRRYIDYRWPGSRTSLIARTRLIDDLLAAALSDGVEQVVILGAGFDSRAYRIPGAERSRFFEVDHPNTSSAKQGLVLRSLGSLPPNVKYVEVDFQCDSLQHALASAGFQPQHRSFFLWEGVSNYLAEAGVRSALRLIAGLAAGTQLVFTYVDEAVLRDPARFPGGKEVQRTARKLAEPWTFGIHPDHAKEFFRECGLHLDSDQSAAEYRRPHYGSGMRIRGYEFYHLVTAHVPDEAEKTKRSTEVRYA
jgi:methyltransferase (TIGR00027 family)